MAYTGLLAAFVTDWLTPLGFGHGYLYVPFALVAGMSRRPNHVIAVSLIGSALIVAGGLLSLLPVPAFPSWIYITNRAVSIATIAVAAIVALLLIRYDTALRDSNRDLQRTKSLLDERLQLLDIASEAAHIGGWRYDLDTEQVSWSNEVARIHRQEPGFQPTADQAIQFYAPEYRERIRGLLERCGMSGQPFDEEMQIIIDGGQRIWVRVIGVQVREGSGRVTAIQGAFQDIHLRMLAHEETRQMSERLRSTLENISDGFIMLDKDWRLTFINLHGEAMVNRTRNELLGKSLWKIFPEAVGSPFESHYRGAVEQNQSVNFEEYFPPLKTWFSVSAYPSDEGLAIYFRDITHLKSLETQLQEAQRLEAVGQLTGGIAHDFNNLLTVVIGNAELLAESLDDKEEPLELVHSIQSAANRGADLTKSLLAFARRQPLQPKAVDAVALVHGLETLLRRALGEDIDLKINAEQNLRLVQVDPAQLESALLNLALNARDAMPDGGRLTVELRPASLDAEYAGEHPDVEPGDYVLLVITDTGVGIAPQNLPKLFEPFYTTKERSKGSGLGLSMVFGFVKQSGGHVAVYSEVDVGTSVRMYLPPSEGQEAAHVPESSDAPLVGGSETILLVEDDDLVRQFAVQQLRQVGYTVLDAPHGPAALAIMQSHDEPIDLLFTDVIMPGGMSGKVLADAARLLQPDLKVLFSSGYTETAILHHGRLDADVSLLSKPYRRAELVQRIREALDDALNETP
ncbi:MAG: ATP-binding protein [Woeseia sp.]